MASGGARPRSGPPKDPNAVRRPNGTDVRMLPAAGFEGPVPAWPLDGLSDRESELWELSWRMPQAAAWSELRLEWAVALYVRSLVRAEEVDSTPPARTLVRQLMDDLGLTAGGLAKNGWRIGPAEVLGSVSSPSVPVEEAGGSVRDRLKVVRDGAA
jgi:hypothetical protein